ncbi:hypothetical protein PINS_up020423, partial [Pythium insidiosum]
FLQCHGEQLRAVPLRGNYGDRYYLSRSRPSRKEAGEFDASTLTLRDLVVNGIRDEELALDRGRDLRAELAKVTEFPGARRHRRVQHVVREDGVWLRTAVDVKPSDIAVIDALTTCVPTASWRTAQARERNCLVLRDRPRTSRPRSTFKKQGELPRAPPGRCDRTTNEELET